MEFVSTKRGGRRLFYGGYAYILDKQRDATSYWRCEKRGECKARLTTEDDHLKNQPSEHSHPRDPIRMHVAKTVSEIRQHAITSEEPTSTILQNCTMDFPLAAAGQLPRRDALERMVRRKRQPPDGDEILDDLRRTSRGEEFFAHYDDNLDLHIFTTDTNLQILSTQRHWFCDGTFDSAPERHQLYTVHAIANRTRTVPLVYAVTRNKDQVTSHFIGNDNNIVYNNFITIIYKCLNN